MNKGPWTIGLNEVMHNLNVEIAKLKTVNERGLIMAAAFVRRETEKGSGFLTPVDLGNLRASWFTVTRKGTVSDKFGHGGIFKSALSGKAKRKRTRARYDVAYLSSLHSSTITNAVGKLSGNIDPAVTFGYSASYAEFVHDRTDVKHWTRRGSGRKWFQATLTANKQTILNIIEKASKIRG